MAVVGSLVILLRCRRALFNAPLSLDSFRRLFHNSNIRDKFNLDLHILFPLNIKIITVGIRVCRHFSKFPKKINFKFFVLNDYCYNDADSTQPAVTPSEWQRIT